MDKAKFIKWFDEFAKQKEGFRPKDIGGWYDRVIQKQKEALNIIKKTTFDIEIPDVDNVAPEDKIYPIYSEIIRNIPTYLTEYNFSNRIFQRPTLAQYKEMSVAKHILTYCKRKKLESSIIERIGILLSHMGQIWAEVKFKKICKKVTLGCCPLSYVLLGNYNVDKTSCFGQGRRQNPDKRFAFGVHPNVFVVLFHKTQDIVLEENTLTIDGRMLLWINKEDEVMNFASGYGFGGKVNVHYFCQNLYEQIFNSKSEVARYVFRWADGLSYTDHPVISIYKKGTQVKNQTCSLTCEFHKERYGIV